MTVEMGGKVIQNHTELDTEIIFPVSGKNTGFSMQCSSAYTVITTLNKPLALYT
jgi:hypothetical protein